MFSINYIGNGFKTHMTVTVTSNEALRREILIQDISNSYIHTYIHVLDYLISIKDIIYN